MSFGVLLIMGAAVAYVALVMALASASSASAITTRRRPSTALSTAIQQARLRAFFAYFLVLKSPKIGKKPLAKLVSFPLQSLPRVALRAALLLKKNTGLYYLKTQSVNAIIAFLC